MRKFLRNQKGVTMMEVLVTVAILSIVVVPCLSSFVLAQRGNVLAKDTYESYTKAANVIEVLKGVPVPQEGESTWADEILKQVAVLHENKADQISVFGAFDSDQLNYYVVEIYAGEIASKDAIPEGTEPVLKGVIAP